MKPALRPLTTAALWVLSSSTLSCGEKASPVEIARGGMSGSASGTGGSSATAGTPGQGGSGASAGSGSGATAGTVSGAGTPGSGGVAGNGGTLGNAGSGGDAGAATGGSGGDAGAGGMGAGAGGMAVMPRTRVSVGDAWRFKKGDPPGGATNLGYTNATVKS